MSLPTNLSKPNTLIAGTDALAADVNGNLDYITAAQNTTNAEVNIKAYLLSPALTGAPTAPTATPNTNTTQIASTAFVIGQAGSNNPIMDSTAAVGTSTFFSRQDHVHPSDSAKLDVVTASSTYAPLASPALTGNPTAPTPTVGDNDTSIATTAFVQAAVTALIDAAPGTMDTLNEIAAALGDDPNFATTMTTQLGLKAPLASPALTGTPTVPTAAADTSTTQAASTAFVTGQASSVNPVMDGVAPVVGTSLKYARADHVHQVNPQIAADAETASTAAGVATSAASTATTQAGLAVAAYDSFDDRYLGAKTANPTLDNDGNALLTGALYWNSVSSEMRAYTGSAWVAAYVPSSTYVTLTGVETLTNKTLTTPDIGTPSAGNLSSCTVDGTNAVGYKNIPQNSQSAAYTCVLTDAGKHILHPSADTTARTITIPANSSVAYPIGTALTFVNQASAGVMTIAITTDTMRLAGAGTTGSRTLAANGVATALKLTATEWIISGSGLT